MKADYRKSGEVLRASVQGIETAYAENEDVIGPYTKDLEAFVDQIYAPIVYDNAVQCLDNPPEEMVTAAEETRDMADVEDELGYWAERFGTDEEDAILPTDRVGPLLDHFTALDENDGFNEPDIVAPAVSGIEPGLLAQEMMDAEDLILVGYGEKTREEPREVAFTTDEASGDVLVTEDSITTGASVAGAVEALDTADVDKYLAMNETGRTYEVVSSPTLRRVKGLTGAVDTDPDRLLKMDSDDVEITDADLRLRDDVAPKATAYASSVGLAATGLYMLAEGHTEQFESWWATGTGSTWAVLEYGTGCISEMIEDWC